MAAEFRFVYSSHIDEIGYDAETRRLIVRWQSGAETVYEGVPYSKAQLVWSAPSVGEALHRHIRGQHDFRTVKPGVTA
jgi:KTSC domain-containing protein